MTNPRGAASVTLDTIISKAIAEFNGSARDVREFHKATARAITDALLANGQIREQGIYAYTWERSLVIPLEAS